MKKTISLFVAGLMLTMVFSAIASAHVVVYPKQATQGTYEKFTVRVPVEKDIPTIKVALKVPSGVDITSVEPIPGWKYEFTKDNTDKITTITWTATAGGLQPSEFGEFSMQGRVGDHATSLRWPAYQTYQDGSQVEWTGAEGSDTPASVTVISAKTDAATAAATGQNNSRSDMPLFLSIAALVIALLALVISFNKSKGVNR